MSEMIILAVVLGILLYGLLKGVPVYDAFIAGAREGLRSAVSILPNLAAMLTAIALLNASGLMAGIQTLLAPLWEWMGIPQEAGPLMIMRPFSGSGSLAMLGNLMETTGPDSRAGLVASTLMGSSETIFYTLGIYMAAGRVTKSRYALPAALLAWLAASCTAGLFYR
ncbi:MAG: spore maturation protein [Clostridia bacterium]|nr:spore maturation protein [Clostridia bacterium]